MARPRSPDSALRASVRASRTGVVLFGHETQILYVNDSLARLAGMPADQLIGVSGRYHSELSELSSPEQVAAALCPPPECFSGELQWGEVRCPGHATGVEVLYIPLNSSDGKQTPVAAFLMPEGTPRLQHGDSGQAAARRLHAQLAELRQRLKPLTLLTQVLGISGAARRVQAQVDVAARSSCNTLIWGPPGSGRETVARAIYYHGEQASLGRLLPLSCGLVDNELLESSLRSFVASSPRWDADIRDGVLLLDVDELPADSQYLLASVLERIDDRWMVVSTSRRPLTALAAAGGFLMPLAERLTTLTIQLPPLAERREDIPLLAQAAVESCNRLGGPQRSGLTAEAMDLLHTYEWPGNVDELRQVVEQASRQAEGDWIEARHLDETLRWSDQRLRHPGPPKASPIDLDQVLQQTEQRLIREAVERSKGNKAEAAKLLGISWSRLLRRLQDLDSTPAPDKPRD